MTASKFPCVITIRCRVNADHIRLSARSQANPSAGDYWQGSRSLFSIRRSFPASFSRDYGLAGRIVNLIGHLARGLKPRLQLRQKTGSGLFQAFENLLRVVGLVHDENSNHGDEYAARQRFFQNRKQLFRG